MIVLKKTINAELNTIGIFLLLKTVGTQHQKISGTKQKLTLFRTAAFCDAERNVISLRLHRITLLSRTMKRYECP